MAIKMNNKGKAKAPTSIKAKKSNRPRSSSVSSGGPSGSETDEVDDKAAMLAALQAHGQAMFGFSGPEQAETSEQGRRRLSGESDDGQTDEDDEDDEDEYESDDGWVEGDEMVTDSEEEDIHPLKAAPGMLQLF